MDTITLKARGKINLTLDVIGKRPNGYHDLRMIMQTINLFDTIHIQKTKTPGIKIYNNIAWLPKDDRNITYKAAQLFLETLGIESGLVISITKRIPVAAGLAGGSSDAAAVLIGLNKMFKAHLSRKKLMEMGLHLGADVPFCIMRGTVLAEGIGEKLTPLRQFPYTHILLAKPNISVSTASVYKALNVNDIKIHPKTDEIIAAIQSQRRSFVVENMANVLEEVTIPMHPEIDQIKEDMKKFGAVGSMMSGSGPTVFGVFANKEKAYEAAEYFKNTCGLREVHVTSTFCKYKGGRGRYER
ncbi:MAG: 4-(cytidine 5'-diphospho)-2-C-methyl-D-erythritol kinase [Cellulosilyticaceae bacterium]